MMSFEQLTEQLQEETAEDLSAQSDRQAYRSWSPGGWFNDLKLASKIRTIFGTFGVFIAAIAIVLGFGISDTYDRYMISQKIEHAVHQSADLRATIGEFRYHSVRYIFGQELAAQEKAYSAFDKAQGELRKIGGVVDAHVPQNSQSIDEFANALSSYRGKFEELSANLADQGASEKNVALAYELSRQGDALFEQSQSLESELTAAMQLDEKDGIQQFYSVLYAVGLLLALSLISVAVGFRFLVSDFARKIREITDGMTSLTKGSRDFEISGADRKDEVGEMLRAMTLFKHANKTLKKWAKERAEKAETELKMQSEAQRARDAAEEKRDALLAELAGQFERSVGEVVSGVASASTQLQTTARAMAETAEESSRQTQEVATSMEEANAGATSAAAASDEFAMSIGEISRQAASSAEMARKASDSANQADKTISELSASAEQVGEIVELIHTIAQRTNLLALNASIEAARGGESGRGFAVVASEVKELAMQTSRATDQVAEQIRAMQDTTGASVSALRSIASEVERLESTSVSIASAVDQQSVAGQDLARSIDLAARGSERVSNNIEDVRALSLSTGAAATQVLNSSTDLEHQAANLRQQAQDFLQKIRAN